MCHNINLGIYRPGLAAELIYVDFGKQDLKKKIKKTNKNKNKLHKMGRNMSQKITLVKNQELYSLGV